MIWANRVHLNVSGGGSAVEGEGGGGGAVRGYTTTGPAIAKNIFSFFQLCATTLSSSIEH